MEAHIRVIEELKQRRRRRQRERQKSSRFRLEKQQLCRCSTLFCTFCRHFTTTTLTLENLDTGQPLLFSFSELTHNPLEFNSRKTTTFDRGKFNQVEYERWILKMRKFTFSVTFLPPLHTAAKTSHKNWICSHCPKLYRAYSISFNSSDVGKCFWSWILKDCIKVQEKKKKVAVLCSRSRTKREIRHFQFVVVQGRQRNLQISVLHVQSCCFAKFKLPNRVPVPWDS